VSASSGASPGRTSGLGGATGNLSGLAGEHPIVIPARRRNAPNVRVIHFSLASTRSAIWRWQTLTLAANQLISFQSIS
jgi:hypothetical protein